jgi:hypothetical protein
MAARPIGDTSRSPLMRRFVEQFEKTIGTSPLVLSSHVEKLFGPSGDTVYLKGSLRFINSSVLEFALFATASPGISINKYRYQYMSKDGRMIFRYDNAPHHPEISSFPHHKHTSDKVALASMPGIKDILNEISALILQGRS